MMMMTTTMMTITPITLHGGATWTKLQTAFVNESFTVHDAEKHGGTVFSSLVKKFAIPRAKAHDMLSNSVLVGRLRGM
jgi:hypothetical protein